MKPAGTDNFARGMNYSLSLRHWRSKLVANWRSPLSIPLNTTSEITTHPGTGDVAHLVFDDA
jgi:hypothetical protein